MALVNMQILLVLRGLPGGIGRDFSSETHDERQVTT
jgi:hypothetical protein